MYATTATANLLEHQVVRLKWNLQRVLSGCVPSWQSTTQFVWRVHGTPRLQPFSTSNQQSVCWRTPSRLGLAAGSRRHDLQG